jgi:hypothetical protein
MPTQTARRVAAAFLEGKRLRTRNTYTDGAAIFHHGNRIVWRNVMGHVLANMCGWGTVTTRDRINAVADRMGAERVYQTKFVQFHGAEEIGEHETFAL